ncbi:amino acid adenylation domain-containing protein [Crocosphaera sp.]|uniref:non-ribosomal peptide synthetase n=1 Tax=Crocosphaera sp. TaxID=2729996 RepID=UPI003F231FBD|nr:amino acid adenylation domain-containing protein [Crocosphaera sp.]
MSNEFDNHEQSTDPFPLFTPSQQRQPLAEWTENPIDYPRDATIPELFQLQAARIPDRVAIAYKNQEITYYELDRKSNQLAHYLQKIGVKEETLVPIYLDKNPDLIITILAILKAGGAYLPLDTSAPSVRIQAILEDAKASIIVTQKPYLDTIKNINHNLTCIDIDNRAILEDSPDHYSPKSEINGDNLAYVIYTSGSTGKPKGVCVVHRGVVRLVKNNNYANFKENEVILQLASIAFDAATFEIWQPLLNGGKLVLIDIKTPSLEDIGEAIKKYKITSLFLTTALFNLIVDEKLDYLKPLERLLTGGEAISLTHVRKAFKALPNCQLIHVYGPTESTTFTCFYKITIDDIKQDSIPIGRAIANTQVYILDEKLKIVPIGVVGELYIGGEGLARGYLNQPKLTEEKFIKNPFNNDSNSHLYKTGDLVRWDEKGRIEFLGRIDFQVKIRGYRIELGEIETVLNQHSAVKISKVIVREDIPGHKELIAYLIFNLEQNFGAEIYHEIRNYLKQQLPDYMVPAALVAIDSFPLNINGKIDYRALPAPDFSAFKSYYVAPQTPTEEIIANIWSQVLKIEKIGINDNFFELGGNSLLGTQVISRLRENLNLELSISLLFEYPTIAQISQHITVKETSNNNLLIEPIQPIKKEKNIPLSFAQKRLWFLNQLDSNNTAYNLLYRFHVQGSLNINAVEKSLSEIRKRHEILRTSFVSINGKITQKIEGNQFTLPIIDLQQIPEGEKEIEAEKIAQQEANYHFNLGQDCLFRVRLIRLNCQEYHLLFNIHHIIFDGWSFGVLFSELKSLYSAYLQGLTTPLPSLPIQYADFTLWQKNNLTIEVLDPQLNYWKQQLHGTLPILKLPTDHARPKIQTYKGATQTFLLSSELTTSIKAFSKKEGVTLFMTLLAAFKGLLSRYSGQKDIIVGTAIAGRKRKELEHLIGFFVNTLALRSHLSDRLSLRELLNQIKKVCLDAYAHQDVPFEQLVETLQPERNLSHHPIFQVMFILQNTEMEALQLPDLKITTLETSRQTAKFDLTLSLEEQQGKLRGEWEYNTDLFESSTIERMAKHFQILLSEILSSPEQKIHQISLLTEKEKNQLLVEYNQTQSFYPKNIGTHQLFEQQVQKNPKAIALIFEEQEISYQTLNILANKLAYKLEKSGVNLETIVGIYLESSAEMIITMLAILKAGGAYLPLDPSYPEERINYMLEDAEVSFLVSTQSLIQNLPNYQGKLICVDKNKENNGENYQDNFTPHINSHNLAYIIYTSGSTGKPKGVQIEHKSLINLLFFFKNKLNITPKDSWLSITTLSFDIATLEIFLPLITGAKLILASRQVARDGRQLVKTLHESQATILQATPSTWQMLLLAGWKGTPNLTMLTGGEALSQELANQLLRRGYRLYNVYGPTETTIWSLCDCISNDQEKIAIGRPINNTKVYILDTHLQPVPIGVSGELYIAGDGLARGYFNRSELTKQKFIESPFEPRQKLYKTGDLAAYRKDGKIEFLGRIDNQVKVRGFRIELGEIEAALNQHPQIKDARVAAKQDEHQFQQLVAYIVLDKHQNFDTELYHEIRGHLQQKLPNYMIPAAFVTLESFPLTPNGKIDYRALPAHNFSAFQRKYVAPRTPTEEIIANIWKQVLSLKSVGIHDNFFELGGHSLLGTQIISRIRDSLKIEVSLKLLFECPTIAELSEHIEINKNVNHSLSLPSIVPRETQQALPLSFAQEGLWFLTQLEPNSTAYNMPFIIEIKGSLNINALEKSINEIIKRHEILRTNFISIDGQPTQIINQDINCKLSIHNLKNIPNEQKKAEAEKFVYQFIEQPFNLDKDSLFSVKLLHLDSETYWLLFNIHHIIFDGWSYELLKGELFTLYQAYEQEKFPEIAPLSIQYADFSLWQRHWFTDENLQFQLSYWKEQLKGTLPILKLPIDFPRTPLQTYKGDSYSWYLSSELITQIKSFCQREGVTLFMTFLTVFKILLSRYTAEKDVIVGTPIASRNRTEIENLIGFFINTVALRTNLGQNPSFRELLSRVQQVTLDAYAHQDFPFEKLVQELKPERNLSYNPIFQVWFNLINLTKNEINCNKLQIKSIPVMETMAKFDLSFYIEEEKQEIKLKFVYNNLLFNSNTIEGMARHFQNILEQVIVAPENKISSFSLFNEKERYQLTHQRNEISPTNSFLNFPKIAIEQSIPSRFEEQVNKYPDKIAVQSKDNQYTYQQLNNQADKIAQYLLNLTSKKQVKVALFFDHNVSMIAAIMGVLKAGQMYVPLDPNYPQDRISYILKDSCTEVILTNDRNLDHVKAITQNKLPIININQLNHVPVNLNLDISPETLAYLLYTSGSTGKPKGIIQNHRNVLHFIRNHTNNLHISADDNLILLASYSFDAAVIDIFSALLNGATLTLFDIKQEGLNNLSDWLQAYKITIYHSTPTVYRYFLEILDKKKSLAKTQLSHIRLVILGGETVVKKDVELYQIFFADHCLLVNGLGATECSFYLQYLMNKSITINQPSVPVGYGFEDSEIILLDENGKITDVCGEIAVKSPYIALGYWQKEDLTKTVFLENFQGKNQRVYRTGDWGYLRNNGVIECLGRKDFQVKIRGFRIELGETEAVLKEYSQVKDAVVVDTDNRLGEKQLIAYIVPQDSSLLSNDQPQTIKQCRAFLQQKLPSYMIPTQFIFLETLPFTPNGKVDRRILAMRNESEQVTPKTSIAPPNPLELELIKIWQNVLGLETIAVKDNFFDLGGHSLLAVRLVVEIEKVLHQKLSLGTLFQFPTVEQLAEVITRQESCSEAIWPMQPNGGRPPLFFVHVLGRGLKFCRPIVKHLDPDQPVYGLNAQMSQTQKTISNRVEDLATYYIEQMRMIQPEGPYLLAGISFGGKVAYEMAQQLQSQGETVSLLALFDTYGPDAVKKRTLTEIINFYWTHFLEGGFPYLIDHSKGKVIAIINKALKNLIKFGKNFYVYLALKFNFSLSEELQDFMFQQKNRQASIIYIPRVYSGNVSLFLAQEKIISANIPLDPQLGWGSLVTGKLAVYEIPGTHLGMLQAASAKILAEKLTLAIETID